MGRGQILEQVISGGQTGVDQVALKVVRDELRLYKTGGVAPKGWRTDAGPAPWLADYGLKEHSFSSHYAPRTQKNVFDSEGTVWFGVESPGYHVTYRAAELFQRHWIENPSVSELQRFLIEHEIRILNVAGNRLRTHPESADRARVVLLRGLIPF